MWWKVLGAVAGIQLACLGISALAGVYKYFMLREHDLIERYGKGSWVVITGSSSGQGRCFAMEFAKRGFNVCLTGSFRNSFVFQKLKFMFPNQQFRFEHMNFSHAFRHDFFEPLERVFETLDVSVVVNCIGHRVAHDPSHKQPMKEIHDTVVCGTAVQARVTQLAINQFLGRVKRSALIWITAQTTHPCIWPGMSNNAITVPYLACYEATNAWGFHHAESIIAEYGSEFFDVLNVTPGAVCTENTKAYLEDVCFSIDAETFVKNILSMLGNVQGTTDAHWGHALSSQLIGFAPFMKRFVIPGVGLRIAEHYQKQKRKAY